MDEYMELVKKSSGEIWKFFKMYLGIKQNEDERWEECISVADELIKPYMKTVAEKYVRNYMNVIINELERVSKL